MDSRNMIPVGLKFSAEELEWFDRQTFWNPPQVSLPKGADPSNVTLNESAQWAYNCNKSTRRGLITVAEQQAILHPKRKPAKRNSKPAIKTHDDGMLILALRDKVAKLEHQVSMLQRDLAIEASRGDGLRRLRLA